MWLHRKKYTYVCIYRVRHPEHRGNQSAQTPVAAHQRVRHVKQHQDVLFLFPRDIEHLALHHGHWRPHQGALKTYLVTLETYFIATEGPTKVPSKHTLYPLKPTLSAGKAPPRCSTEYAICRSCEHGVPRFSVCQWTRTSSVYADFWLLLSSSPPPPPPPPGAERSTQISRSCEHGVSRFGKGSW